MTAFASSAAVTADPSLPARSRGTVYDTPQLPAAPAKSKEKASGGKAAEASHADAAAPCTTPPCAGCLFRNVRKMCAVLHTAGFAARVPY
jgi:hypothetical protein